MVGVAGEAGARAGGAGVDVVGVDDGQDLVETAGAADRGRARRLGRAGVGERTGQAGDQGGRVGLADGEGLHHGQGRVVRGIA